MLFRDELDHLAASRGARVRHLTGDVGPITAERLESTVPGLLERDVHLCASPGLSSAVRDALGRRTPRGRLHEQRFAF